MVDRKSKRLMFLAAIAGSGMLHTAQTRAGTVIPGQDMSLPPEAPSIQSAPRTSAPAVMEIRQSAQHDLSGSLSPASIDSSPASIRIIHSIATVQIYPSGNARPEQSSPVAPQPLGDTSHNACDSHMLVVFADLFNRNTSVPLPGMTGVDLRAGSEATKNIPRWQSIFAATFDSSHFSAAIDDEKLIYFPADFSVRLIPPTLECMNGVLPFVADASTAVAETNDPASESGSESRSTRDEVARCPLGLISNAAIHDIEQRVMRRIGGMKPESKPDVTPADSTELTLSRDLPDRTADRTPDQNTAVTATDESSPVASLIDLSSSSMAGGGGGGSLPTIDASRLLPINAATDAIISHHDSMIGAFRAPAVFSRLAPASGRFATVASSTSRAIPTATSGVSAAISLPTGVVRYNPTDFQPAVQTWISSHIAHISGGRLAGSVGDSTGNFSHAALWNLSVTGFVDVHPTNGGFTGSSIADIRGSQAVGIGSTSRTDHALLWINANPNNTIDLNPNGYKSSYGQGTDGTRQIGYGYTNVPIYGEESHALLWNSSSTDYVDLNPVDYIFTFAYGGDKFHQAGYGLSNTFNLHALVWAGTPQSATDLQPSNGAYTDSRAFTVRGSRAGGYATDSLTQYPHAILWTALDGNSAVDLHPAGFLDSQITALNNSAEVGYGRVSGDHTGNTHALLWTTSISGVVDLNNFLPSRYISAEADGIDSAGNVVGWAKDSITGNFHAVEWLAVVPEPTSFISLAGLASLSFLRSRSRRKRIA